MENDPHNSVLRQIQTLYSVGTFAGLDDGQLLERFATAPGDASELAFAALVERHGPMVIRVCRRILKNADDTQDAFQATFLVLVRKGHALRDRNTVGNWLYGVAVRVAIEARTSSRRRQAHERRYAQAKGDRIGILADELDRSDLAMVLDEEVARLPARYREPVVLCHLQGLTHEQAAHRLGWPVGTVRSRLARGRERLRGRLLRRGLDLPAGALTGALFEEAAGAVPESLAHLTVAGAVQYAASPVRGSGALISAQVVQLAEGAIQPMLSHVLKISMFCLIAGCVIASGVALESGIAQGKPQPVSIPGPPEEPEAQGESGLGLEPPPVSIPGLPEEPAQAKTPAGEPIFNKLERQSQLVSILPNKTRVKKGQLICEFNASELKDRLAELELEAAVAEHTLQSSKRSCELAELARSEYKDGIYQMEMQEIKGEIALAGQARVIAETEFEALKKAHKDSDLVMARARQNLDRAIFSFENAHTKKRLLEQYTYQRKLKELSLDVEKARGDELTDMRKSALVKERSASLRREIELRKILAPADGIVVTNPEVEASSHAVPNGLLLFHFIPDAQPGLPK